jgi:hypothetical protein
MDLYFGFLNMVNKLLVLWFFTFFSICMAVFGVISDDPLKEKRKNIKQPQLKIDHDTSIKIKYKDFDVLTKEELLYEATIDL